jgi:hypothetical protein
LLGADAGPVGVAGVDGLGGLTGLVPSGWLARLTLASGLAWLAIGRFAWLVVLAGLAWLRRPAWLARLIGFDGFAGLRRFVRL